MGEKSAVEKESTDVYFDMYRPERKRSDDEMMGPLCQIGFGTNLTTDYPEADQSEFCGVVHLYTEEDLLKWYQENGYATISQIDEPPKLPTKEDIFISGTCLTFVNVRT